MFDNKLEVKPRSHQQPVIDFVKEQLQQRPKQTVENRPDLTWEREERNDIDYKGYKRYFYEFKNPDAQDKELHHAIIAAPTMNDAITEFMDQVRGPDWYENAVISVEVIGVDLRREDAPVWVLGNE